MDEKMPKAKAPGRITPEAKTVKRRLYSMSVVCFTRPEHPSGRRGSTALQQPCSANFGHYKNYAIKVDPRLREPIDAAFPICSTDSLAEACALLADASGDTVPVAGGTDLTCYRKSGTAPAVPGPWLRLTPSPIRNYTASPSPTTAVYALGR